MNILIVHGFEIATQINRISFTITVAFTYTQKLIEYKTAAIHFFFYFFVLIFTTIYYVLTKSHRIQMIN